MVASDSDDRGYDLKLSYDAALTKSRIRHEIYVDSRGIFDTITTVQVPREYILTKTVSNMRDSFQAI